MMLTPRLLYVFLCLSALVPACVIAVAVESRDTTTDNEVDRFLLAGLFSNVQNFWNRLTLGLEERSIDHGGLSRMFLEHKPRSFPATGGSLVLLLHGGTESMYSLFSKLRPDTRRWVSVSNENNFLLLAPNAGTEDGQGFVWNIFREGEAIKTDVDDVGFISSLVQWAIQERGVDPSHVYITGASNGGAMTYRMLIEKSDMFASGVAFIANLSEESIPNASSSTPIMIMNGTEDPFMRWDGGPVGTNRGSVRSALATRDYWINANNVDVSAVVKTDLPDLDPVDGCRISLESYPSGDAPVLFYTMQGGGHVYPSRNVGIGLLQGLLGLGPPCRDEDGADLAWEFMSTYG